MELKLSSQMQCMFKNGRILNNLLKLNIYLLCYTCRADGNYTYNILVPQSIKIMYTDLELK